MYNVLSLISLSRSLWCRERCVLPDSLDCTELLSSPPPAQDTQTEPSLLSPPSEDTRRETVSPTQASTLNIYKTVNLYLFVFYFKIIRIFQRNMDSLVYFNLQLYITGNCLSVYYLEMFSDRICHSSKDFSNWTKIMILY